MPQEKNFKRLVRRRMAKTGESYTTARSQLRPATAAGPGVDGDPEAQALARALAAAGFVDPTTLRPLGETLLYGAAGGIGFDYFVFDYSGWISLAVSGSFNAAYFEKKESVETACLRLGVPVRVRQTSSPQAAERQLREALASRREVPLTLDLARLPGFEAHAGFPWVPQTVTVSGAGEELLVTGPRGRQFRLGWADMAAARAAYGPARHRLYVLGEPAAALDLRPGLLAAIARTADCLLEPMRVRNFDGNFGVPGMRKWARLLTDARDRRGWPRLYPDPGALRGALDTVRRALGGPGTGGGAGRPLYAGFLSEVAPLLLAPRLAEAAAAYADLGRRWAALVELLRGPDLALSRLAESVLELADAEAAAASGLRASVVRS